MKRLRAVFLGVLFIMLAASASAAKDFDWLRDLNIKAQADPSGFKASLARASRSATRRSLRC